MHLADEPPAVVARPAPEFGSRSEGYPSDMRRSMRGAVGAVASLSMMFAACTSDAPVATAPPVTVAPTTTAVPTTVALTTAPPTTVEPATTPPTTALDDPARMRAAEEAYLASWEAYHAAILDPANPALREALRQTNTPENFELVTGILNDFAGRGIEARPHPTVPSSATIVLPAKFLPGRTDVADLVVCEINSEWYFETTASPDGSDFLIRDEVFAVKSLARVEWNGGRWVFRSSDVLSEVIGQTECSP
jgi:ABC-type transport system substrate-binding protein